MEDEKNEIGEKVFLEVHEALRAIYSPADVPQYEVNRTTIKVLHEVLAKLNLKETVDRRQLAYYASFAAQYSEKSKELEKCLECLHLPLEKFPQPCQRALKALSASATVLELREPTLPKFLLALNHLERNCFEATEEERKLVQHQSKLIRKYHPLLKKVESLQKDIDSSQARQKCYSAEISKHSLKAKFIKSKMMEYKQKEKALQEKLEKSGYNPSISHSELVKKHEEILKLEEQLNSVIKKLNSYHNFPPDEGLARLKVEEANQELLSIEEEIQKIME